MPKKQSPEHVAKKAAGHRKYAPDRNAKTMREYRVWCGIKARCSNPRHPRWKDYGGRGITVCPAWRDSFLAFLHDMGPCPHGMSLDRIDNDGSYSLDNCRWTTPAVQRRNGRRIRLLTMNGETRCMSDWARHLGLPYTRIAARLRYGYPVEIALSSSTLTSGPRKGSKQSPEFIRRRVAGRRRSRST